MAVTIHTAPLPEDAKVLVFVEANAHVTHVMRLGVQSAWELVVGLLDAIDIATPDGNDDAWWQSRRPWTPSPSASTSPRRWACA